MKHTQCGGKYRIGLDIGTGSVGWAVTDTDNNLLQFRGKNMWGVRLFDGAETAKTRRGFRTMRRRLARRRQRIDLLQDILQEMVAKKDPLFFRRMDQTFLQSDTEEEKGEKDPELQAFPYLFPDKNDYQKKYTSIYHLRQALANSSEPFDPRLVYLAIHHIIKYRGNFLYEGREFNVRDTSNTLEQTDTLRDLLLNECGCDIEAGLFDQISNILNGDAVEDAVLRDTISGLQRGNRPLAEIAKALSGYSFTINTIIGEDLLLKEDGRSESFKFDSAYEDKEEEYLDALGDYADVLICLKRLHDGRVLQKLMGSNAYISDAFIERYETHKKQLKGLKALFRKYFTPEDYRSMFRLKNVKGNYANYVRWGYRYQYEDNTAKREDFYKTLSAALDAQKDAYAGEDKDEYEYIKEQIKQHNYLLKMRISENGAIPYQLHKAELEQIIERQGVFYPELKDNKDKLLSLTEYRIPYYVGPVKVPYVKDGEKRVNSPFAWTVKKPGHETDKIYPWNEWERNTDDSVRVIDRQQSAADFIMRMKIKCTYLFSEDTLPKHSLLYSEYCVLNEINKIRIRGHLIDRRVRDELIENCFKKKARVTIGDLRNILKQNCESDWADVRITGMSRPDRFLNQMLAWKDFTGILGGITSYDKPMIEELILWITLFEDKRILREKIAAKYGSRLSEEQIGKICRLNYKGWGSLSRTLLEEIKGYDQSDNARSHEPCSVIDQLRMSNHNLMEIINYPSYDKAIHEFNREHQNAGADIWAKIDGLAGSPALKRGIRQTFRIIDEITEIMKCPPVSVYIESAREDGEKGKTTKSRHELLTELYTNLSTDAEFDDVRATLKNEDDKALRNDRLFLYYTQGGKCMYSGEKLDINSLETYQVDHIVPQTLIKDDSIDNRVLVKPERNQRKSDSYTIDPETRSRMGKRWEYLKDKKLISARKFSLLIRSELKPEELNGFINRQLVETRQIIKHVCALLTERYGNTVGVMALKAKMLTRFRKKYGMYKIRALNDLHHAHDAYICLTIGSFLDKRYPKIESEFKWGEYLKAEPNKYTRDNGWGFVLNKMDEIISAKGTGEVLWDPTEQIGKLKRALNYKDCRITKKTEAKTKPEMSAFYKQTVHPKCKPDDKNINNYFRLKKGLPAEKYGFYADGYSAYFMAVEYKTHKGKAAKEAVHWELLGMPVQYDSLIQSRSVSKDELVLQLINKQLGKGETLKKGSVKVLRDNILCYQLVEQNGHPVMLTSASYYINAKPLFVDKKYLELLHWLLEEERSWVKNPARADMVPKLGEFLSYYVNTLEKEYGSVYQSYIEKVRAFITPGADGKSDFGKLPDIPENLSAPAKSVCKEDFVFKVLKLSALSSCQLDMKSKYNLVTSFGILHYFKLTDNTVFIDQSVTGLLEKRQSVAELAGGHNKPNSPSLTSGGQTDFGF